jgi:hypothetical protein
VNRPTMNSMPSLEATARPRLHPKNRPRPKPPGFLKSRTILSILSSSAISSPEKSFEATGEGPIEGGDRTCAWFDWADDAEGRQDQGAGPPQRYFNVTAPRHLPGVESGQLHCPIMTFSGGHATARVHWIGERQH